MAKSSPFLNNPLTFALTVNCISDSSVIVRLGNDDNVLNQNSISFYLNEFNNTTAIINAISVLMMPLNIRVGNEHITDLYEVFQSTLIGNWLDTLDEAPDKDCDRFSVSKVITKCGYTFEVKGTIEVDSFGNAHLDKGAFLDMASNSDIIGVMISVEGNGATCGFDKSKCFYKAMPIGGYVNPNEMNSGLMTVINILMNNIFISVDGTIQDVSPILRDLSMEVLRTNGDNLIRRDGEGYTSLVQSFDDNGITFKLALTNDIRIVRAEVDIDSISLMLNEEAFDKCKLSFATMSIMSMLEDFVEDENTKTVLSDIYDNTGLPHVLNTLMHIHKFSDEETVNTILECTIGDNETFIGFNKSQVKKTIEKIIIIERHLAEQANKPVNGESST